MKGPIGPDQFPDNLRHTSKDSERGRILLEQFPLSDVRLDVDAITKRREEIEAKRQEKRKADKNTICKGKYAAKDQLPDGHQPYHAATEHSNPWRYQNRCVHTSWESSTWGPAVASKVRILGTKRLSEQPRCKTHDVEHRVEELVNLLDADGNRIHDDNTGEWKQGIAVHYIPQKILALDEDDQRVREPNYFFDKPTFEPRGTVTTAHSRDGQYTARREAYAALTRPEEMSDVEDGDDYMDDDVPLLVPGDEGEQLDDNPPIDSDDDEDDEHDPFTLSYLGLDTDMPDAPPLETDVGDGEDGGEDDGRRLPHGKPSDGKSPGGSPPADGTPGTGSESDNDDDENDNPKPSGSGGKRKRTRTSEILQNERKAKIQGETFDDLIDEEGARSWVTLRHQVPGGQRFLQRDRIPAFTPENKKFDEPDKQKLKTAVYPSDATIPAPRGTRYDGAEWVLGKDSVFHKRDPKATKNDRRDLSWRPVFVLRKFHRTTGEYVDKSDKRHLFNRLVESNLSPEAVTVWNKSVRQYKSRSCADHVASTKQQAPWSAEEVAEAVRYLNNEVQRRGVIDIADNWKSIEKAASAHLDDYRTNELKKTARGKDSTRTKFSRAPGVQKKLEYVREHRDEFDTNAKLKQKNLFTAQDFKSESKVEREKKKMGTQTGIEDGRTAKKRDASGKTKTKGFEIGEISGADDKIEGDEEDAEVETDDGEDVKESEDEVEVAVPSPTKRRKY